MRSVFLAVLLMAGLLIADSPAPAPPAAGAEAKKQEEPEAKPQAKVSEDAAQRTEIQQYVLRLYAQHATGRQTAAEHAHFAVRVAQQLLQLGFTARLMQLLALANYRILRPVPERRRVIGMLRVA